MNENILVLKRVKFSVMFILGLIMIIFPNSLISILLFVLGLYLTILGFYALISAITLIKFSREWRYEGIKALLLLTLGIVLVFNTGAVAAAVSGFIFIVIGIIILLVGIAAIVQTREYTSGLIFIIVGLLIGIFPLGVSFFITRIIGVSLVLLSISLLFSIRSKSF